MLREVCFCGWEGTLAEREPVYAGDGEWGLACPNCHHLDLLVGWPAATRHQLLTEATQRHAEKAPQTWEDAA